MPNFNFAKLIPHSNKFRLIKKFDNSGKNFFDLLYIGTIIVMIFYI
jgi:hypothetical protein